jgi:hypothetical protein
MITQFSLQSSSRVTFAQCGRQHNGLVQGAVTGKAMSRRRVVWVTLARIMHAHHPHHHPKTTSSTPLRAHEPRRWPHGRLVALSTKRIFKPTESQAGILEGI